MYLISESAAALPYKMFEFNEQPNVVKQNNLQYKI